MQVTEEQLAALFNNCGQAKILALTNSAYFNYSIFCRLNPCQRNLLFFFPLLKVVDCRVCGDPNSCLHFAFIEFTDEGSLVNVNRWLLLYKLKSLYIHGCKDNKNYLGLIAACSGCTGCIKFVRSNARILSS